MEVLSEQKPSGEKIKFAPAFRAMDGILTSYHIFQRTGCLAAGPRLVEVILRPRIPAIDSGGLSCIITN
jgi:hypothetical protein